MISGGFRGVRGVLYVVSGSVMGVPGMFQRFSGANQEYSIRFRGVPGVLTAFQSFRSGPGGFRGVPGIFLLILGAYKRKTGGFKSVPVGFMVHFEGVPESI